jgi:hypothetical protein
MAKKTTPTPTPAETANVPATTKKLEVGLPFDYGEDSGAGTNDMSQQERGLPFLKVLQPMSPEVVGPQGQVAGAKAGQFYNTGTGELYDRVTIVPACRVHAIQEWRPRKQGGGLVNQTVIAPGADYPDFYKAAMDRCKAEGRKFGDFWTSEPKKDGSNELAETFQVFAVVLDAEQNPVGMVVVPFSSTSIQAYKKQYSRRIGQLRGAPPMFAFPITLSSVQTSNEDGTWFTPVIEFPVENNPMKSALDPKSAAYQAGKELHGLVKGGHVKADEAAAESSREGAGAAKSETSAF